mgnify:CR=1 FL=1
MLSRFPSSKSINSEIFPLGNSRLESNPFERDWNADVPSDRTRLQAAAAELGARLADRIPGAVSYACHLTNSGSEAMDAVLEHAYQTRLKALRAIHDSIGDQVTDVWLRAVSCTGLKVPGGKPLTEFLDDLEQRNLGALESFEQRPVAFAFRGSAAGRGVCGVVMKSNPTDRGGYAKTPKVRTVFLEATHPSSLAHAVSVHRCRFLVPVLAGDRIEVAHRDESLVFACLLNTQLIANGIGQLPSSILEWLAHGREGLPLVIEETQIGCGGENGFYAFEQTPLRAARPEYVLLSRVLGGWGARIGGVLIRSDILRPEFEVAEKCGDAFSLEVALAVLDAMESAE